MILLDVIAVILTIVLMSIIFSPKTSRNIWIWTIVILLLFIFTLYVRTTSLFPGHDQILDVMNDDGEE